jgi:hypothetical protein
MCVCVYMCLQLRMLHSEHGLRVFGYAKSRRGAMNHRWRGWDFTRRGRGLGVRAFSTYLTHIHTHTPTHGVSQQIEHGMQRVYGVKVLRQTSAHACLGQDRVPFKHVCRIVMAKALARKRALHQIIIPKVKARMKACGLPVLFLQAVIQYIITTGASEPQDCLSKLCNA